MNKNFLNIILLLLIYSFLSTSVFATNTVSNKSIVFISDTHAVVDAKDRNLNWNNNSFERIQAIVNTPSLQPTHIIWTGDIIDYLPEEWEIAGTWIRWIQNNSKIKQYAVMGNHDYFYYDYPEVFKNFNYAKGNPNYLSYEIKSNLKENVKKGDLSIKVNNVKDFLVDKQILLIQKPDFNTNNKYFINTIKNIDEINHIIYLSNPVTNNFSIENTSVRQGITESRGIQYFLNAFKTTETKETKNAITIGNNCLILMSMDNYYKKDINNLSRSISDDDFKWFENQLKKYEKTHNVIVVMHELPESGKNLGEIYDPRNVVDYDDYTRKKFFSLIDQYNITAWVSGHIHPDARTDKVQHQYKNTTFLVSPSQGTGKEGQVLKLELLEGSNSLIFNYWSIDKNEVIKQILVKGKSIRLMR